MIKPVLRPGAWPVLLAGLLAALGVWAAPGQASASGGLPGELGATPGCLVLPNCVSLYLYRPAGSPELVLQAAGEYPRAPLLLGVGDPVEENQDWTYIDLGTVRQYRVRGLPDTLALSAFDVRHYGGAELYQLEFSPGGVASGLCAANVGNTMMLRGCNGSKYQTLISAARVPGSARAPAGFRYGLSAAPARVPGHHLAIGGSGPAGGRIRLARPAARSGQLWQPS